eukprot:8659805-Pyramimonas_sp.AAC.1
MPSSQARRSAVRAVHQGRRAIRPASPTTLGRRCRFLMRPARLLAQDGTHAQSWGPRAAKRFSNQREP